MQKITKTIRTLAFALCLVLAAGLVLPFAANAEAPAEPPVSESSEAKGNVPPIAYIHIEYLDVANRKYLGECFVNFETATNNVLYADQLTNIPEGYELYNTFPIHIPDGKDFYYILLQKTGDTSAPEYHHLFVRYIDSKTGEQIGLEDNVWIPIENEYFDPYGELAFSSYGQIPKGYIPQKFDDFPVPEGEVFEYLLDPVEHPDEPGYRYLRVDYVVKDPDTDGTHTISQQRIMIPEDLEELTVDQMTGVPEGYKLVREEPHMVYTYFDYLLVEIEKVEDPTDPSEPETTEPETTDPTEPETTEPETTEPSVPETTKPEATEPSVSETTEPKAEDSNVPDTGDETNLAVLMAATVIALTGAAVLVISLKKNRI